MDRRTAGGKGERSGEQIRPVINACVHRKDALDEGLVALREDARDRTNSRGTAMRDGVHADWNARASILMN